MKLKRVEVSHRKVRKAQGELEGLCLRLTPGQDRVPHEPWLTVAAIGAG